MPLYIKSPLTSSCNTSAIASASLQMSNFLPITSSLSSPLHVKHTIVPPLPRFATVRCSRKSMSHLLRVPIIGSDGQQEVSTPAPFVKSFVGDAFSTRHQNLRHIQSSTVQSQGPHFTPRPGSVPALIKTKVSTSTLMLLAGDEEEDEQRHETNENHFRTPSPGQHHLNMSNQQALLTSKIQKFPVQSAMQKFSSKNDDSPLKTMFLESIDHGLHSTNPFLDDVNKYAFQEAVTMLQNQGNSDTLLQEIGLHPETLRQIMEWQGSASHVPLSESIMQQVVSHVPVSLDTSRQILDVVSRENQGNISATNSKRRESLSSYFINSSPSFPCRRAYKYKAALLEESFENVIPETSTPKFLLDIRDSRSNISLVPMVSSTCPSLPSSTAGSNDTFQNEISESDISDVDSGKNKKGKKIPNESSIPMLRSKMKKLMRKVSDMNAFPEVMDIFIDNLPPVVQFSPEHLQRLNRATECKSIENTTITQELRLADGSLPFMNNLHYQSNQMSKN